MRAEQLTREDLIREIRRLRGNISKRVKRIERSDIPASTHSVEKFNELVENTPSKLGSLKDKDLRDLYRDYKYLNSLKTSTVKGAIQSAATIEEVLKHYETLSEDKRSDFNKTLGRVEEHIGHSLFTYYKYDIYDAVDTMTFGGEDPEEAARRIIEAFDESIKQSNGGLSDDKFRIQFSENLGSLLSEY